MIHYPSFSTFCLPLSLFLTRTTAIEGAVNNIVDAAPLWLECLRQITKGKGKHEEMQVATRQISACSAQLVAFINTQCAREL